MLILLWRGTIFAKSWLVCVCYGPYARLLPLLSHSKNTSNPNPNLKSSRHPLPHSTVAAYHSHRRSEPSTHHRWSCSTTTSLDPSLAGGSLSSTRCRFVRHHTTTCTSLCFSVDLTCGQGSSPLAGFRVQKQRSSHRLRLTAFLVLCCCRRINHHSPALLEGESSIYLDCLLPLGSSARPGHRVTLFPSCSLLPRRTTNPPLFAAVFLSFFLLSRPRKHHLGCPCVN